MADIPFIAIAPIMRVSPAKRIGRVLRLLVAAVGVVVVCMVAIGISVLLTSSVGSNPYVEVDRATYTSAMSYVNEIRSDAMDDGIRMIVKNEGDAKDRNYIDEYWSKYFRPLLANADNYESCYYIYACYGTWQAEYHARKYEYMAENSGIFSFVYREDAATYRHYADKYYIALQNADSESQLREIVADQQEFGFFKDTVYDAIDKIVAQGGYTYVTPTDAKN